MRAALRLLGLGASAGAAVGFVLAGRRSATAGSSAPSSRLPGAERGRAVHAERGRAVHVAPAGEPVAGAPLVAEPAPDRRRAGFDRRLADLDGIVGRITRASDKRMGIDRRAGGRPGDHDEPQERRRLDAA